MLTLKAVKIAKFMSEETLAYAANIYWQNKKVGDCSNDGHGGSTMVSIQGAKNAQKKEMEAFVMAHPSTLEWQEKYPPQGLHPADETWTYYLELLVDHLAYEVDELRDLKRICKKTVLFRVKGDPEGEYRTIKTEWGPAIEAHLAKKYGDDMLEILNEKLAAKLAN
jgi:hypothetical protein